VAVLRLGGDPVACWSVLGEEGELAAFGRALGRAMVSGAPLAEAVARLADDQRARRRRTAEAAARAVGVRAVGPLGLCFLPAFVLVGVVPVIVGVAGSLTNSFG
jgi:pilus assembly protein TadC